MIHGAVMAWAVNLLCLFTPETLHEACKGPQTSDFVLHVFCQVVNLLFAWEAQNCSADLQTR